MVKFLAAANTAVGAGVRSYRKAADVVGSAA
jgi:hypothetical protein